MNKKLYNVDDNVLCYKLYTVNIILVRFGKSYNFFINKIIAIQQKQKKKQHPNTFKLL